MTEPAALDLRPLDADALLAAEGRVALAVGEDGRLGPAHRRLDRAAKGALFKSGADHLTVLKWKEIYDALHHATLKCRAACDVVESVVLEYA